MYLLCFAPPPPPPPPQQQQQQQQQIIPLQIPLQHPNTTKQPQPQTIPPRITTLFLTGAPWVT